MKPEGNCASAAPRCVDCNQTAEDHIAALCRLHPCRDPQCAAFNHNCPGCGNNLHGDNLCMVSACEQEV